MKLSNDVEEYEIEVTKIVQNCSFNFFLQCTWSKLSTIYARMK